ncbi:MAG: hypothetical protein AB7P31_03110 [Steroidobacteraceae bacterium]
MTIKRGRILRDTSTGEGLVFVDGNQHPFRLEGMWKSEFAPKVNMTVDVEFDDAGKLVALRNVSGGSVAGEQAAQAIGVAQEKAKQVAAEFQAKGLPVIQEYAKRIGYPVLGALLAVIIGWYFLPAISVDMNLLGKSSVTFYEGLKYLNSGAAAMMGGGSTGVYGLLCFVALLAVLLPYVWKHPRAGYAMASPLVLMLLVLLLAWTKMNAQFSEGLEAASSFGGDEFRKMAEESARQAAAEMRKAVSIGIGVYLAFAGAIYLTWRGVTWKGTGNP